MPSLQWENVKGTLCLAKDSGGSGKERCEKAVDALQQVAIALIGSDAPYSLFINEPKKDEIEPKKDGLPKLWWLADEMAFAATITNADGGFTIPTFYKPSRDFGKVEVTGTNADNQPKKLTVKVHALTGKADAPPLLELHASGDDCIALNDSLPFLLGRSAPKQT